MMSSADRVYAQEEIPEEITVEPSPEDIQTEPQDLLISEPIEIIEERENPESTEPEPIQPTEETTSPAAPVQQPQLTTNETTQADSFSRMFLLDNGRKYFTPDEIKGIIDLLAENNYSHIQLAFGNDGLRYLLDDMNITTDTKTYSSEDVKQAIHAGNIAYYDAGAVNELTQSDMDSIIDYAHQKKISVIPLINSPGHMHVLLTAMKQLGIPNASFQDSKSTMDISNSEAKDFVYNLIKKYADYFSNRGSTLFNLGCDEYALDIKKGFQDLIDKNLYGEYIKHINRLASGVKEAGLRPMAFNDGFYYNQHTASGRFDTDILIAYWHKGWEPYHYSPSKFLANQGHELINTHAKWYFVVSGGNKNYSYETSLENVNKIDVHTLYDNSGAPVSGSMFCLWCDNPRKEYTETIKTKLRTLLEAQAKRNPNEFARPEESIALSQAQISDPPQSVNYTGASIRPDIQVRYNDQTLIEGQDYLCSYFNNQEPGIATIQITGIGSYTGQIQKQFEIVFDFINGFVRVDGKTYYYQNGTKVKGQKQINGYWYMFEMTNGVMQTGWFEHDKTTNPSGGKKTVYYDGAGHMLYGYQWIGNNWYWLHTGSGNREYTGVVKNNADNRWYFVRNGIGEKYTGTSKSITTGNYFITKDGILDWNYTGFGKA
ncbi:MAG: family 20 glycosylhydrolase, partial [Erysipelotrichaceae bacterium]|nr:family 20 glycosylhydrolase [Erysipelotrichaceae bacterium]